ncbi:Imm44 family immunity protein [Acinetobacter sp. SM34]|uniref:Imm44 family immunity protein n=1 Tax=Acinetobacter sp. SM34 TaxID=1301620 RepID=UPI001EDB046B|nr:Imm44 family immunity protein [Acinetobacter sp. SM34]MCG2608188.1 Imm44 family immunity protein [Acinetobacter sp. SM34]
MQVWLSSESSKEVLNEEQLTQLRLARNYVENTLKSGLEHKTYDLPLDSWDCITVMMGPGGFEERVMYSFKKKIMDFRLKINHEEFNSTDDLGRQKLIFEMMLRSLDLLKIKFEKVRPKLDEKVYEELERLKKDFLEIANIK